MTREQGKKRQTDISSMNRRQDPITWSKTIRVNPSRSEKDLDEQVKDLSKWVQGQRELQIRSMRSIPGLPLKADRFHHSIQVQPSSRDSSRKEVVFTVSYKLPPVGVDSVGRRNLHHTDMGNPWDRGKIREIWSRPRSAILNQRPEKAEKWREDHVNKVNEGNSTTVTPAGSTKWPLEWKEQVVRIGTGYRVRKDEKDPRKRRFDVGYADLKGYRRKDGREVVIDQSNMGRTISASAKTMGPNENPRVKVINAVSAMEKRRPASEYTGSGIIRKSQVGKQKLKPTKPSGKE